MPAYEICSCRFISRAAMSLLVSILVPIVMLLYHTRWKRVVDVGEVVPVFFHEQC